jgi:hypothetical protein
MAQGTPFGECRAGYWSSNRNLDDKEDMEKATCFASWRPALNGAIRLGMNVRVGFRDAGRGDSTDVRLREGFVEVESGDYTWRVGRQIIAWGRADRINPTDSLSQRDLTLLVPDDDEQRNGINAVLLRYNVNNSLAVTAIAAQFEANRVPQGTLPSNLIRSAESGPIEWALKLDRSGGGVDWSVSYFDGFNSFARYSVDFASRPMPVFHSEYEQVRTLGADFALANGAWTMRGEASYSHLNQRSTSNDVGQRKVVRAVLGVDRDVWDTANANFQLFCIARSYQDLDGGAAGRQPFALALERLNSEFAAREWGVTLRVSDRFLNDRLKVELAAIADVTGHSFILRPRASHAISDSLKLDVGIDYFRGGAQTYFGARQKNQAAFVELTVVY